MSYGSPANPVGGTVITTAYAVANILDPIRWLRLLTGNADPPGTNYVVVSTSTSGTVWARLSGDTLAPGAVVSHLGYTPVNRAGDVGMTGNFTTTGLMTALGLSAGASGVLATGVGGVNVVGGGGYAGGSTTVGSPSVLGLSVGASGVAINGAGGVVVSGGGPISGASSPLTALSASITNAITAGSYAGGSTSSGTPSFLGVTIGDTGLSVGSLGIITTGAINPASYTGGSTSTGTPSLKGLVVGTDGVAIGTAGTGPLTVAGSVTPGSYAGGSLTAGIPSVLGLDVGTSGIAMAIGSTIAAKAITATTVTASGATSAASYAGGSTSSGTPSFLGAVVGTSGIASTGQITVGGQQVYHPGNPPPLGSGAAVPAGLIAAFATAAAIATGWSRCNGTGGTPNMDGRVLIGAGTTFSTTFTENTATGASWSHSHADNGSHTHSGPSHTHSGASLGVSGSTGTPSGTSTRADGANAVASADHTHNQGTLDVTGSTAADGTGATGAQATTATSSDAWLIPNYCVVWARKD